MASSWQGERLKDGDIIRCEGKLDLLITDQELREAGYNTEYIYKINNVEGFWLEIRGKVTQ